MITKRWHYLFPILVIICASAYWVGSLIALGPARLPEIVLYRPAADTQYTAIISSLSHLNFGDPNTAGAQGRGIMACPYLACLPHGLCCAVFGNYGYWVGDVLVCLFYFVVIVTLLREFGIKPLPSLWIGCGMATGALNAAIVAVASLLTRLMAVFHVQLWDWGFPNPIETYLFNQRVPRPMVTEPVCLLLIYFLVKLWKQDCRSSFFGWFPVGLILGIVLSIDPYMFVALALMTMFMMLGSASKYGSGAAASAWSFGIGCLLTGWIFMVQQAFGNPEEAVRLGLDAFNFYIPHYSSWIRVGIIISLALLVIKLKLPQRDAAAFWIVMMIAAWLAQPVQLTISGKGAQLAHYRYNIWILNSYAIVILVTILLIPAIESAWEGIKHHRKTVITFAVIGFIGQLLLSCTPNLERIFYQATPRGSTNDMWYNFGDSYREGLADFQREISTNYKSARTFSTTDYDAYILMTSFDGKLAFTPDPFTTTLSDNDIEQRVCALGKMFKLSPLGFCQFCQCNWIDNYLIGHNKYHLSLDSKTLNTNDYPPQVIENMRKVTKHWEWIVVIPDSQLNRLANEYIKYFRIPIDTNACPDLIITTTLDKQIGLEPVKEIYRLSYSNHVFMVYEKN